MLVLLWGCQTLLGGYLGQERCRGVGHSKGHMASSPCPQLFQGMVPRLESCNAKFQRFFRPTSWNSPSTPRRDGTSS